MLNYAKGQPIGNNQIPLFDCPPAVKAIARYNSENATASSVITLTQDTTAIEVVPMHGSGAIRVVGLRWIATSDTEASVIVAGAGANFDHICPTGNVRRFVVPVESGASSNGSVQGANRENGLFRRVAFICTGISSVLVTEYGSSNSY